ncbi:MAG: tetratricopeptide (TPR) repeat protein [Myxococcota bacterium]|jgi:tetratricopeptide (TPR) repeat protein
MKRWFIPLGLLLSLPIARAQGFGSLGMLIQRGQFRLAAQNANKQLEATPDSVELHAILGVAWSKNDFHADALGAFLLCVGATYYEDQGIEAHADGLRAIGRGREAAALRLERLLGPSLSIGRELRVLLGAQGDLREIGDFDGAMEIADRAEALFPRSPMVFAAIADIHLDMGDLDSADEAIWMMEQFGETSRGSVVRARRAIADGDFTEADTILEEARKFRTPTVRIGALRAEVLRLSGDPHAAADLLERNRWRALESSELIQTRLKVYTDMGDTVSADYWAKLAADRYGDNLNIQDGLSYYTAAR